MNFHRWLWCGAGVTSLGATYPIVGNSKASASQFSEEIVEKLKSSEEKFCWDDGKRMSSFSESDLKDDSVWWIPAGKGDWCGGSAKEEDIVMGKCDGESAVIAKSRAPRSVDFYLSTSLRNRSRGRSRDRAQGDGRIRGTTGGKREKKKEVKKLQETVEKYLEKGKKLCLQRYSELKKK